MNKLNKILLLFFLAVFLVPQGFVLAYDPSITATMTTNTAPSGYITNQNNCMYTHAVSNNDAWKNFDGSTSFDSNFMLLNCEMDYKIPTAKVLTGYGIYQQDGCTAWTVSGSNMLGSWNTLDMQTGQNGYESLQQYSISNTTPYDYYSFKCTSAVGSSVYWSDRELYYYGIDNSSPPTGGAGITSVGGVSGAMQGMVWGIILLITNFIVGIFQNTVMVIIILSLCVALLWYFLHKTGLSAGTHISGGGGGYNHYKAHGAKDYKDYLKKTGLPF